MKLRILASPSHPGRHLQAGMSMVELMVGITIGMFVVAFFVPVPIVAGAVIGSGWKAKPRDAAIPPG